MSFYSKETASPLGDGHRTSLGAVTDDAPPDAGEDAELAPKSLRGARPYIPRVRDVRACLSAPSPALRRRVTVGDASWE